MIDMFSYLKKNGVIVSDGMSAENVISTLSSVPTILNQFPVVSGAVKTLQTILNTYNTTKKTLASAISTVEDMEDALEKAQRAYDMSMAISPGVFTVVPIIPPAPSPTIPAASTGFNALLETAYVSLEEARKQLTKIQEKVLQLESQLKSQISSIINLIFTSKV